MSRTLRTPTSDDFVNFNGLRVERNAIPSLISFLVQADPMTVPSGEGLAPQKRDTVSRLFHMSFQEGGSEAMLVAAMVGDKDALRYLTGLMASRL
jgi:uncharacterized circularly permuted ATP-grasp superfamily protein